MNPLFSTTEKYMKDALLIDDEFSKALLPIFTKYHALGFKLRELGYLAHNAINVIELSMLISPPSVDKEMHPEENCDWCAIHVENGSGYYTGNGDRVCEICYRSVNPDC